MAAHPRADLVVTNWLEMRNGRERIVHTHLNGGSRQALETLFSANWLHNGNVLYRSATVGVTYFMGYQAYAEWTWLAFRLALDRCRIVPVATPTFRYHQTPGSLSQSDAYAEHYLSLFDAMLLRRPPPKVARMIRRKISAAWHDASVRALQRGRGREALVAHLRSLFLPEGGRYLSHSRHIVSHWLRRA
jgi:hypothetical protein